MTSVGNLFICGASTSGAWSELSDFCGNNLEGIDGRGRLASFRAGGVRRFAPLTGVSSVSPAVADAASRLGFSPPASFGATAVARSRLGAVYVWGAARAGERGTLAASAAARESSSVQDMFDAAEPSLVPRMDAGVVDVAIGAAHVTAVTSDGLAYAWGSDARGQLGVSPTSERGRRLEKAGDFSAAPARPGAGDFCGIPRTVVSLSHVPLARVVRLSERLPYALLHTTAIR
jgi:alpha-tubulin suppressor-like RCC1 family protein